MGNAQSTTTSQCVIDPKYDITPNFKEADASSATPTQKCELFETLTNGAGASLEEKQKKVEAHGAGDSTDGKWCNAGCENVFLEEFYETAIVKRFLEDQALVSQTLGVYKKIVRSVAAKRGADFVRKVFDEWVKDEDAQFPASQKNRDWSRYTRRFALEDITGMAHDPTSLLLAADFLKRLAFALPEDFQKYRDDFHWSIQRRLRGFRNNQKNRDGEESTFGIMSFDDDYAKLPLRYFQAKPWLHPGRSKCKVSPPQGIFEHSMHEHGVPLKCGLSGSSNFWTWTAMYGNPEAPLTPEEVRLYVLSSFVVMAADGGHSLMEVLGGMTSTAIFWRHYAQYAPADKAFLAPYLEGNGFAATLYDVLQSLNPFGSGDIDCAEPFDALGKEVYGRIFENRYDKDVPNPPPEEVRDRQKVEAFFLREGDRYLKPFGNYATFLDQLPELQQVRDDATKDLVKFANEKCKHVDAPPSEPGSEKELEKPTSINSSGSISGK